MPSHSKRGAEVPHSPIRSLLPYAKAAKAQGKHIFHLNIGQPDIETPVEALEAVHKSTGKIISYGPSEGIPSLRETVAGYYEKFDANLTANDIYVTTGASEAILFTLLACCDPGDEVIIPEPFYANYLGFAQMGAIHIVPLTTTLETQFRLPEPEVFEQLISPRTKAIFLCNPGNPTGQLYGHAELQKLMKLVRKHDLFLIVDEVYREFCYGKPFTSVLSFEEMEENVIVIDSISKVFSSCGARVGYLITKNRHLQRIVDKYAQLRLSPPYFGQLLAEACYLHAGDYIERAKAEYDRRRHVLYEGLSSIEGVECYMPEAAFYNMAGLPVTDAAHFCKWLLTDFELDGNTVMLAPGNGFYFHKEPGKNQVRIAYILNEQDLRHAVECLKEALKRYSLIYGEYSTGKVVVREWE
jgi:aspartate aminotransferase